ncbi:hypothetical protein [Maribacter aurantiacus]|uniref:Outer membrane lipoprotein carrier protein LolA n=1 Tax=Maribacter aurantiacus TaxID=1882343 RepID=A0A5R8M8G1_9FLAO|nr:hypothetical protein [Maribacter aurantiacus]TLF45780.1 hypothetical protein FEK29_06575 [Maribacter aurantiacus]
MKAILTFSLVLFFGGISLAQDANINQKVATLQEDVVLVASHLETKNVKGLDMKGQTGIARLYRYKNSRVKSALFFTTKNNKPKLA